MIQPVITGDRGCAGVATFSERVIWLQKCTSDIDQVASAFHQVARGEPIAGRMLDAAYDAIKQLREYPNSSDPERTDRHRDGSSARM